MMQSMSALSSNSSTSSSSRMLQKLEEKVPLLAEGEVEKKLRTILGRICRNEITQLDLSFARFGKFYEKTKPFVILQGHRSSIKCLIALPNGLLASGSSDNTIKLWDLTSHSCIAALDGHASDVRVLTALPNGLLASGSSDRTIKLWDLTSHSCIATLAGHTSVISALTSLPNGSLASGSWDNTIKLWDLTSYSCIATLAGHASDVYALVALPNGLLASGSWDKTVKLWDLSSKSCIATLADNDTSLVSTLAVLPNGLLVSSGYYGTTVQLWDFTSRSCISTLALCCGPAILSALPNGLLVSGGYCSAIKLWDLPSGSCLTTLSSHHLPVLALVAFPNGLIAGGSGDGTILLWNPQIVSLSTQYLHPILTALQTNTSVSYLDLSGNAQISDDILDPLAEIFKLNFWSSLWSKRQPDSTLKAINLQKTGVTKKCIRELQKVTHSHSLSVDIYSDEDGIWGMICFLLSFCRANRNSSIVDSGLDLCVGGEFGRFFGIPHGWFTRSKPKPVPIPRKNSNCSIQ